MKKQLRVLLLAVIIIVLTACSSNSSSVKGTYLLTKFMYEGWDCASAFPGSKIIFGGADDNSYSSIEINGSETFGTLFGHITTESKSNTSIKYKFWVDSEEGDFFREGMKYVYLYYYPQEKIIEVKASGDISMEFTKED